MARRFAGGALRFAKGPFMKWAGAIVGMPFSLEGFAFFTEAVFLGIYMF
jgi:cytochrome bd-type quinol oxidase subunit 1